MRSGRLLAWAALSLSACAALPPPTVAPLPDQPAASDDERLLEGVDRYIESLADSRPQKHALRQLVAALNATLKVDLRVNASMKQVAVDVAEAVNCVWSVYDDLAAERVESMRRLVLQSSPGRRQASERYERARAGAVVAIPAQNTCK